MICPQDWATEKNLNLKPFKTVFPSENKGLETHFLAIFFLCLEPKPFKKCFWHLFLSAMVSVLFCNRIFNLKSFSQ